MAGLGVTDIVPSGSAMPVVVDLTGDAVEVESSEQSGIRDVTTTSEDTGFASPGETRAGMVQEGEMQYFHPSTSPLVSPNWCVEPSLSATPAWAHLTGLLKLQINHK